MTKTEIKKALYKQKPSALLLKVHKGNAYYSTVIQTEGSMITDRKVDFVVPVSDMGDAPFMRSMEAQLLNRWIITNGDT